MPTYEYRCEACEHQYEVFARMSDPDPTQCPACGAAALVKVLFPVAVHYKGSGFYSTDYSGKGKAPAASPSGSEGASSSDSSASSAGESSASTSDSSSSSAPSTPSTSD